MIKITEEMFEGLKTELVMGQELSESKEIIRLLLFQSKLMLLDLAGKVVPDIEDNPKIKNLFNRRGNFSTKDES